jgi:integrase
VTFLRDRVMWGLLYLAGLRTEEALALRWQDIRGLSRTGGRIAVDRVFVAGEIRHRTKTGAGRDVEIIAPLAEDLLRYEQGAPTSDEGLVCPSRAGMPILTWRTGVRASSGLPWPPWASRGRRRTPAGAPTSR